MREFKFRAWDTTHWNEEKSCFECKMFYYDLFSLRGSAEGIFCGTEFAGHLLHKTDEVKTMQYTGLKDKNGKEIYEDDIVKYYNKLAIIKYVFGKFAIDQFLPKKRDYSTGFTEDNLPHIIVVGNTCENPELLEVSNG